MSNRLKVSVGEILTCAENIQVALKAPPKWKPGLPLFFSHPPAISTEEMRRGKLADYNLRKNQIKVTLADDQAIVNNIQAYVHVVEAGDPVRNPVTSSAHMKKESNSVKISRKSALQTAAVSSNSSSSSSSSGGNDSNNIGGVSGEYARVSVEIAESQSQQSLTSSQGYDSQGDDSEALALEASELEAAQGIANRKRVRDEEAEQQAEAAVAAAAARQSRKHQTNFFGFDSDSDNNDDDDE